MASFDIIDAAGHGYRDFWRHRREVARLAAAPLVINIACGLASARLGDGGHIYLRTGLATLPAILAQGWMLGLYVRLLFFGESWRGDPAWDGATRRQRVRCLFAATALFALTRFLMFGLTQAMFNINGVAGPDAGQALGPDLGPKGQAAALTGLALAIFAFWGIRLAWLFIPAALGYPLVATLRGLKGFIASFFLAATALVCYLPVTSLAVLLIGPAQKAHAGMLVSFAGIIAVAIADVVVAFILTGGIAYGLRVMLGKPASRSPRT